MIREELPAALDGERLDRVVALVADISRSVAASLVAAGAVRLDERVVDNGRHRVGGGQTIEIDDSAIAAPRGPEADAEVDFEVVYRDRDVLVIDKPPGLVVHPAAGNTTGTLVNGLLALDPAIADVGPLDRPGIVHRLDAGSSGLLVVARTQAALEALGAQFAAHTATRRYRALVWGHPAAPHGVIDAPIGRDRRDPLKMAVVADGRAARTAYQVTATFRRPEELALLDCELETGRTHQIRVHLSSIGHPLVGDPQYGGRRPTLGLERPFLHARELSFDHPTTRERLTFESALPRDLADFLGRLGE